MTNRTRYFLGGSMLIVVLSLCTGLVAYYNGDLPLFHTRVGPSELAYVSADATGVAYANVREIMNSEFRQRLPQALATGEGKNEFFNETGIDIEHDINTVVAASGAGNGTDSGVILIRGLFDEGRIETLVRQHEGTVEEYKGKRLLLVHPDGAGNVPGVSTLCLTFPETGLAVLGNQAAVKQAIDVKASGHSVTANAELMKYVGQLDGAQNTAWVVGGLDALTKNANVPQQVKDQLPGVQWFALSVHINGGVNGLVQVQARDPKAADDLRAVVNGALAAGRLVGGQDVKFTALMNSLQLKGTGNDVELAFSVPPEVLDMVNGVAGLKNLSDAKNKKK